MSRTAAAALLLTSSAAMLLASSRQAAGRVEPAPGDLAGAFSVGALTDRFESLYNMATEQNATTAPDEAAANVRAFLATLQRAEGTAQAPDPYRVCYGYRHTLQDMSDHPAITGEWAGERLPDAMCEAAGFGPGCRSTAAGAYQIIRSTWQSLKRSLSLPDFGPASQDAAAVELIRQRGALQDVRAGRFAQAVHKCRAEWASLPGNYARQGQRTTEQLAAWYSAAGGTQA